MLLLSPRLSDGPVRSGAVGRRVGCPSGEEVVAPSSTPGLRSPRTTGPETSSTKSTRRPVSAECVPDLPVPLGIHEPGVVSRTFPPKRLVMNRGLSRDCPLSSGRVGDFSTPLRPPSDKCSVTVSKDSVLSREKKKKN